VISQQELLLPAVKPDVAERERERDMVRQLIIQVLCEDILPF